MNASLLKSGSAIALFATSAVVPSLAYLPPTITGVRLGLGRVRSLLSPSLFHRQRSFAAAFPQFHLANASVVFPRSDLLALPAGHRIATTSSSTSAHSMATSAADKIDGNNDDAPNHGASDESHKDSQVGRSGTPAHPLRRSTRKRSQRSAAAASASVSDGAGGPIAKGKTSTKKPAKRRKVELSPPASASVSVSAKQMNQSSGDGESEEDQKRERKPWYDIFTKGDEPYNRYMATEWGFEKRGDVALFEKISLEGAQAGLSWLTILRKREAYRRTFHHFDIDKVAAMTQDDVQAILDTNTKDTTQMIVRHRGKIESVINNAQKIQEMRKDNPDDPNPFDTLLWSYVDDKPILYRWNGNLQDANTKTPESTAMSKDLKKRGFKFVGPTTCYAMMQSVGMVIEHATDSSEWEAAVVRLKQRKGGYQESQE